MRTLNKNRIAFFLMIAFFAGGSKGYTQNFYGYSIPNSLVIFNPTTCEVCQQLQLNGIAPANQSANGDIFVTGTGNVILTLGNQLLVYDPPNPNPVSTLTVPGITQFAGTAAGPGNTIYVVGTVNNIAQLYTYDPDTNSLTFIGAFGSFLDTFTDLWYENGVLYGLVVTGGIFQINVNNPLLSTQTPYGFTNFPAITDGGFYVSFNLFGQLSISSGQNQFICNEIAGGLIINEFYQIPASVMPTPNCNNCISDAGTVNNNALRVCLPGNANIPFNNNATLDANDILQYAVVSNPNDPEASLLYTGNTNPIPFDPSIFTIGVTYYVGTVVGNNVAGSVSLSDPCLDFSNLTPLVWQATPSVSLSAPAAAICANQCITLTVDLIGVPPFTLQGEVLLNGLPVENLTNTFNSNTGTLQLCAPAGSNGGNLSFTSLQLSDTNCTCN